MKLLKNKSFKAIVITKKRILLFVCLFSLITFFYLAASENTSSDTSNRYAASKDFHNYILSSGLHQETDIKDELSYIISAFLGFDLDKPETILYNYSDKYVFDENNIDPKDIVYPQPTSPPEPSPSEKALQMPIGEINISKGLSISNSAGIDIDPNTLVSQPLSYTLTKEAPQILIVHTHTTESYTDTGQTKYTVTDSDRSTDESENITAVGNAMYEVLTNSGIPVIHDKTVHDYPSYNGAYNRSKATVLKNLNQTPSIKVVLDIHRDGLVRSDGTKLKVVCDIDGQKTAQCMFVVGTNNELSHDNWQENMKLACKLQAKANELYPDLMRPINLRSERFNQQLSKGAIIIEIGSNGNTLEESIRAAQYMGRVIAEVLGN